MSAKCVSNSYRKATTPTCQKKKIFVSINEQNASFLISDSASYKKKEEKKHILAIHFHTHNINFTQNGLKGEEKFQFLYKISCCVRFYLRFFHLVYRLVLDAVRSGVFIKLTAIINFQAHEKWYLGKKSRTCKTNNR